MIDGSQGLIDQIKIKNRFSLQFLQRQGGKIERATVALAAIAALHHFTVHRIAMHATDQRAPIVQQTTPLRQEHAGLHAIRHLESICRAVKMGLKLTPLGLRKTGDSPRHMLSFKRKNGEGLITTTIAASLTINVFGMTLPNGLRKSFNPINKCAIGCIGIGSQCQPLEK
jgi:hypothetical protein